MYDGVIFMMLAKVLPENKQRNKMLDVISLTRDIVAYSILNDFSVVF